MDGGSVVLLRIRTGSCSIGAGVPEVEEMNILFCSTEFDPPWNMGSLSVELLINPPMPPSEEAPVPFCLFGSIKETR